LQVNATGGSNNITRYFIQTTVNPQIGINNGTTGNIKFPVTAGQSVSAQIAFVDTVIDTTLPDSVYANGTALPTVPGEGATLTATAFGPLGTHNGLTANTNSTINTGFTRALVINQPGTNAAYNGDYTVIRPGSIYTSDAGATSVVTTTITVTSVTGLVIGQPVTVFSGTGAFAPGTPVTSISTANNTFRTSAPPTVALSGGLTVVKQGTNYTSAPGATSSLFTTISVASVAGLTVGMTVTVLSGTGAFAPGTTVSSISTTSNQFFIVGAPTIPLSGGAVIRAGTTWQLRRIQTGAGGFGRYTRYFMVSNTGSTKAGKYYFTTPNATPLTNATTGTAPINIVEYGGGLPTLQEVLDNNHELVDGNNFQGTDAGRNNEGTEVIALGTNAGENNVGNNVNAIGEGAANGNRADFVNAIGEGAAQDNSANGSFINVMGFEAGKANEGFDLVAIGKGAGTSNTGDLVIALGTSAAQGNTGENVTAIGNEAGENNPLSNQFIISNLTLPSYANYTAASTAISATGSADCTYMFYDESDHIIKGIRL
jgi:hypothetical protein